MLTLEQWKNFGYQRLGRKRKRNALYVKFKMCVFVRVKEKKLDKFQAFPELYKIS